MATMQLWNRERWLGEEGPPPLSQIVVEKPLTVETVGNRIYFYSHVDTDRCLALMKALRELDSSLRAEYLSRGLEETHAPIPIWLHIQSAGGGLFSGLAVSDQIGEIKSPIYSIVEGYCASAATLISMSCSKRFIRPSGFMLIHQLSSFMWGKYEEFKDEMRLLDMAMERLVTFYSANSKIPADGVRELLKRDSWFDAAGAIERGLVDQIL